MGKLEELKNLLARQNFEGRMDVLIDQLADIALNKYKTASVSKPASVSKSASVAKVTSDLKPTAQTPAPGMPSPNEKTSPSKRSRYIPVRIRRQVLLRDQNGCTYKDPKTGRVCGSRHGLQLDHIMPFSWGGEHSVDNLALRCGAHNRYCAEQMGLFRPN
jgi:hypothetical protein